MIDRSMCRLYLLIVISFAVTAPLGACSDDEDTASKERTSVTPPPEITLEVTGSLSIALVYIQPGTFTMGRDVSLAEEIVGSLAFQADDQDEQPARRVKITRGFYIGTHKVTVAAFCSFLNEKSEADQLVSLNKFARIEKVQETYVPRPGCEDCATNTVTWEGALAFCEWLSKKSGLKVRLPTEAEWEFTARGPEGRMYPWGNGSLPGPYMRDHGDKEAYPHLWSCDPVGTYSLNVTPQGVLEMADSIGEWCSDYYMERYDKKDTVDPQGPSEAILSGTSRRTFHVLRRCMPYATQRAPADVGPVTDGVYGLRVVVEVPADGE